MLSQPWTDAAVVGLVVLSVSLLAVELSLPLEDPRAWWVATVGDVLTGLFAVELGLRFWVAGNARRFLRMYWIDLIAVLPFARPARLFRVLRVLRLVRAGVLLDRRLRWRVPPGLDGAHTLVLVGSLATASVLVGAFLLASAESGTLHGPVEALWFSVFMLVSGEPIGGEPVTLSGRMVTLGLMFGGLSFFGVFVGTVSAMMTARLTQGLGMSDGDLRDLHDHIVVCGWNRAGATMLRELYGLGDPRIVVVLVTEGPRPDDLPFDVLDPQRFHHHEGDWTRVDVLHRVNVKDASRAILLTDETIPRSDQDRDARTVLAALTIEKMAPDIYTVAEVTSEATAAHLEHADVEEVILGDWYAGMVLGAAAANPGVVSVLDEVLSHTYGNAFQTLPVPAAWVGRSVRDVRALLQDGHEATLVSLHGTSEPFVNPPGDTVVEAGHYLVVLARGRPTIRG